MSQPALRPVRTRVLRTATTPPPPPPGLVPPTAGMMIAATRPENKNFSQMSDGIVTGMNTEVPHRFPNGTSTRLLMTYDNWGVPNKVVNGVTFNNTYDNPCPNPIRVTCSLSETDGSAFYQGKWVRIRHADGTTTEFATPLPTQVTILGGDSADALVTLPASRPAGTRLTEHCYINVDAGQRFFRHTGNLTGGRQEVATASAGEPDHSMSMYVGYKPLGGADASWASSIRHVDAPPSALWQPTILIGDSLFAGTYGWWEFFNDDQVPYVSLARGTEPATSFIAGDNRAQYRRILLALGGYTRAVIQYLTNDLTNLNQTFTLFKTKRDSLLTMAQASAAPGYLAMVSTLPPTATSTDNWTTLANQSLNMAAGQRGKNEQVRLDYNADLRRGTPYGGTTPTAWIHPNGFYVGDGAGAVEVIEASANPTDVPNIIGKWRVINGQAATTDGLHPGAQPGMDAWAAAVPTLFFQV